METWRSPLIALGIAGVLVVVAIIAGFFVLFNDEENADDEPQEISTLCESCITEGDNETTVYLEEASRFTIELSEAKYDQSTLTIVPEGLLGETFGVDANPGYFARTFEAVEVGTAALRIEAQNRNDPDFMITIQITPNR